MQHFKLPRGRVDREQFLTDACRGRSVLHVGCADAPLTEERIRTGQLLHQRITAAASRCMGIDLDQSAIGELRDRHGFDNVMVGDAERLGDLGLGLFEVVVAGEVIEHLSNPGLFLSGCAQVLDPGGRLIITTTNAFCARRFVRIPFGTESVHPDHTYYFSHTTLETLARRYGFTASAKYGYCLKGAGLPAILDRISFWVSPNLAEGIVQVYRLGA